MTQNLLTPALNVFEQMALDEILARGSLSGPVLRFYHWTMGPAVTFGYAQFYASVRAQCAGACGPLCRRPTGGGIVFHGEDLTFSLVFKNALTPPREIYARLHGAVERALMKQGLLQSVRQGAVSASAYSPTHNGTASGCFANPVQDDLLSGGKKILGGAIRRFGSVVLYQGSLQYPQVRVCPAFRRAVSVAAEEMLAEPLHPVVVSKEMVEGARQLARSQYENVAWTEKF